MAFSGEYAADEIIIKLVGSAGRDKLEKMTAPLGGQNPQFIKGVNLWVLKVPTGKVPIIATTLLRHPDIEFIEPNYIVRTQGAPKDPDWPQQSYLTNIQLPQAWDTTTGSPSVIVAVIDTGVEVNHPELARKLWKNPGETGKDARGRDKATNGLDDDGDGYVDDVMGWNTVGGDNQVQDDHGHGTHVAGIIAAEANNGQGIAGVSWGAGVLPIKALDHTGAGTFSQVAEAIVFAADHGATIINLSLGAPGTSPVLNNAILYAQARGALVVAAAGDTGGPGVYYPAALPNVVAVGATDAKNQRASLSTTGDRLDLVAPGVDVYSTWLAGRFQRLSGTSASAAHVSGVAALLAGQPRFDTADKMREALLGSALDLGAKGRDANYGYGLLQAYNALNYVPGKGVVTPTPAPTLGPTPTPYRGPLIALATQDLFAQNTIAVQNCTATNPANAHSPPSFDGIVGSCRFTNAGSWTYNNVQDTAFANIRSAALTVRFYVTNWVNDQIIVEISPDNGANWYTVATFQAGAPPPTALTYYTYDALTYLGTPTQVNNANVRFRVALVTGLDTNLTVYSDQMSLTVGDTFPPLPTPTAPAPAPTRAPSAGDPHVNYVALADQCATCHRGHTASGIVLRELWPEQNVCFKCHTGGGTGTNVQPAFTSYTNTATRFFKHDIALNDGRHRVGENSGPQFGGGNRHVECEDCHEPHKATRADAAPAAPMLPPELKTVSGVDPVWTASGSPSSFNWMSQAQREYQVCFKCHSSFTALPTYAPDGYQQTSSTTGQIVANGLRKLTSTDPLQVLDTRDLARAFNPYNASFHPVAAKGRSTWARGYVGGWGPNSLTFCSDCHTNANPALGATGPHGSPRLHLLDGAFDYVTVMPNGNGAFATPNNQVCFKCHSYATYVAGGSNADTQFGFHQFHNGGQGTFGTVCYTCHNSHGSEQQHLINFDTNFVTPYAGYNSQNSWVPNGSGHGTCYITCHTPGGDTIDHGTGKAY